jgi:hypothetical protein
MPCKYKFNLTHCSDGIGTTKVARRQESEKQTQTRLTLDAERHTAQRAAETVRANSQVHWLLDSELYAFLIVTGT